MAIFTKRLNHGCISIHALREEGDEVRTDENGPERISIHALREEGDQLRIDVAGWHLYFYPRPPRGGRHKHALVVKLLKIFLSTPSARRATAGLGLQQLLRDISIHALREEGDFVVVDVDEGLENFYPRPPRGGRHPNWDTIHQALKISIHALREEGDGFVHLLPAVIFQFLSTPSARRATRFLPGRTTSGWYFYPRPPRGGRQQKQRENTLLLSHYTPPCTNCKEMSVNQTAKLHRYLRKRLVFRCEASRKTMCAADSHWPDIKRSARCLGQILGAVQRARPWSGSCCPAGRTADCPRQGRSGRSALL